MKNIWISRKVEMAGACHFSDAGGDSLPANLLTKAGEQALAPTIQQSSQTSSLGTVHQG